MSRTMTGGGLWRVTCDACVGDLDDDLPADMNDDGSNMALADMGWQINEDGDICPECAK